MEHSWLRLLHLEIASYRVGGMRLRKSSMYHSEGELRHAGECAGSTDNSSHGAKWIPMVCRKEQMIPLKMEMDIAVFARMKQSTPASSGDGQDDIAILFRRKVPNGREN